MNPTEPKQGVTFNKAVAALREGKVPAFVTKRGTNRMHLEYGEFRFDYMARSAENDQARVWLPCPDNEPTDDDRATIWYPVDGEETLD